MTNKYNDLVIDEKELDKQINSGKIKPVRIPRFASFKGVEMNFNDLDPNEKLAFILVNRKKIDRMRDDIIAITVLIALGGLALVGMLFALYEIKSALGINIFP